MTNLPPPAGYTSSQLIFEDTFTDNSLNTAHWTVGIGTANQGLWQDNGNLPNPYSAPNANGYNLEYYSPSQVTNGPNGLTITAVRDSTFSSLGYSWKSGNIFSGGKVTVPSAGGYVQWRVNLPDMTTGFWPALWFLDPNSNNEYDLLDAGFTGPGGPNYCVTENLFTRSNRQFQGNPGINLAGQWVTFGVEFKARRSIKSYVNGVLLNTYTVNVPNPIAYELIAGLQVASTSASGWHTVVSANTPSVGNMYINDVQMYKLP